MNLSELEPRLEAAIGLDAGTLGPTVLRRAVERRLAATGIVDPDAYIDLLRRSPAELQALVEEVVVHESWFLRHPQAFAVLGRAAREFLVSRRKTPFRVLSIPCAGGEEPYSIAMTLLEAGLPPDRFAIDAADVSQPVVDRARAGVYGPRAVRAVDDALRLRYFRNDGSTWTIGPALRAPVRFQRANVLNLAASGLVSTYDAVFCRNLLIYQSEAARRTILAGLRDALAPGGLLFVGHAEMLSQLDADFERLPDRGAFALRRRAPTPLSPLSPGGGPGRGGDTSAAGRSPGGPEGAVPAAARPQEVSTRAPNSPATPKSPAPSSRNSRPPSAPPQSAIRNSQSEDPIANALALANQRRFEEAVALCEEALTRSGPRAETYHALGVIHGAAGRADDARRAHERAVYLDPAHEDSLLALALLARRAGDQGSAARFEDRARRAHQRKSNS
jgi:chemotaxis protein methyltransferase WspC